MDKKEYLTVDKISCYKRSFSLSNFVWDMVSRWQHFAKQTIGEQLVRAIDSISANTAEGFGRYSKKDKVRFYRMAYASLIEAFDWNQKAFVRKLINKEQHGYILEELRELPRDINHLINFTNNKLKI